MKISEFILEVDQEVETQAHNLAESVADRLNKTKESVHRVIFWVGFLDMTFKATQIIFDVVLDMTALYRGTEKVINPSVKFARPVLLGLGGVSVGLGMLLSFKFPLAALYFGGTSIGTSLCLVDHYLQFGNGGDGHLQKFVKKFQNTGDEFGYAVSAIIGPELEPRLVEISAN